jgi:heme/copper-type cytochrome/quinol oxidase subunit 2
MEGIIDLQLEMSFHFIYILTLVTYGLLGSIVLFNEKTHKFSSRVSHWTLLERVYSIIPMISIACIYAPSFSLLYAMDEYPDTYVCVKVIGRQWYWHYEVTYDGFKHYPNISNFLNAKLFSTSIIKFSKHFLWITNNNSKNLFLNSYLDNIYNKKYIVQNKIGWFYKQNYSLHLKLFADIHKNLISLPKILNFNFNSYCLSDLTLKGKYLTPKIVLAEFKYFFKSNSLKITSLSLDFQNTLKKYLTIINSNPDLKISNLINFSTFKTNRLLDCNTALILPTGTVIRALVTASDVIHSWSIPSLGIKTDGIPGRLNQVFFAIIKNGVFYGQCSELCGQYHFAMPIVIKSMDWFSCSSAKCFWCKLQPSFSKFQKMTPTAWI